MAAGAPTSPIARASGPAAGTSTPAAAASQPASTSVSASGTVTARGQCPQHQGEFGRAAARFGVAGQAGQAASSRWRQAVWSNRSGRSRWPIRSSKLRVPMSSANRRRSVKSSVGLLVPEYPARQCLALPQPHSAGYHPAQHLVGPAPQREQRGECSRPTSSSAATRSYPGVWVST